MTADDLRRVAGDRPGVERRVRPVGIAAVIGRLVRAVGIHREQQPREVVRRVGVFPAGIQDAAVVEHRRAPVVVLVEGELADVLAVGVHDEQVRHLVAAAHAGHAVETAGRAEDDPPVGQVARIVVVDVGRVVAAHLAEPAAVDAQFINLPAAVGHWASRRASCAASKCRSTSPTNAPSSRAERAW